MLVSVVMVTVFITERAECSRLWNRLSVETLNMNDYVISQIKGRFCVNTHYWQFQSALNISRNWKCSIGVGSKNLVLVYGILTVKSVTSWIIAELYSEGVKIAERSWHKEGHCVCQGCCELQMLHQDDSCSRLSGWHNWHKLHPTSCPDCNVLHQT